MPVQLIGYKRGMTRVFTSDGVSIPVTVVEVFPNRVSQIKTVETDGYRSYQLVSGEKKASRINKPMAGHFSKAGVGAGAYIKEFTLFDDETLDLQLGDQLSVDIFKAGQKVDVRGLTKGKGFAGTVKRHGFKTQDATHGNSLSHRTPGSTGQCQWPGRVFKGKKMPGQLGNVYKTVKRQVIVKVDTENNFLLIKGGLPGAPGSCLMIKSSERVKVGDKT